MGYGRNGKIVHHNVHVIEIVGDYKSPLRMVSSEAMGQAKYRAYLHKRVDISMRNEQMDWHGALAKAFAERVFVNSPIHASEH